MATAPPPYSVNDPQANPYPPQPPTAQAGYQQAGGYSQHPGSYPPQPGYPPQQAGSYPPQPGYPPQAGYPSQPYPQQSNQPPAVVYVERDKNRNRRSDDADCFLIACCTALLCCFLLD